MLDKEEMEKRLKGIPRRLCVAFAGRSALRVLPLLAVSEKDEVPFWYWNIESKSSHLLAVLRAQHFGLTFSSDSKTSIADDAYDAAFGAFSSSAYAGFDVAQTAAKAAETSFSASGAAANAAETSSCASCAADSADAYSADFHADAVKKTVEKAILSDLELITGKSNPDLSGQFVKPQKQSCPISPIEFLQHPLWPYGQIPEVIDPQWHLFCEWVEALDEGFDIWLDWYRDRLAGKELDPALLENQMNIPNEIQEQGPKSINAYLFMLKVATETETNLKQLNLVRAIFIGNGASGKTSLIRALHGEPVVEGKEEMTPGIAIRSWTVGETAITARFWDFGGQVMSHATHQFFLRERCLYVLVLNSRSEINANDEAEYWLEHVKAFGKNAPVMLIGNKFDCASVNLDMRALREKHPNIVGFYTLS